MYGIAIQDVVMRFCGSIRHGSFVGRVFGVALSGLFFSLVFVLSPESR
jgi:hypothetical protein